MTDQAHEDLDVDEHTIIRGEEVYWAGRDGETIIAYNGNERMEVGYMSPEIAQNHFFKAKNEAASLLEQ